MVRFELTVPDQTLSTSQFAVLGIVGLRGASTPYDIKRALGDVSRQFWSVPHTQCYTETERLTAAGYLRVDLEADGRRRRRYALTDAGRKALSDWLESPKTESMQIRDVAQLKLFCGELTSAAAVRSLAVQQVAMYRERLALLDEIDSRLADDPSRTTRMLPARLGRRIYETALEFWREVADEQPRMMEVALSPPPTPTLSQSDQALPSRRARVRSWASTP